MVHQVRTIFWHYRQSGAVSHGSNSVKRSNWQKRDKTYSVLGCAKHTLFGSVWEREFLYVVAKWRAKFQKPWKASLSYSFAVEMGHFDMVRWKFDSVCIFSMSRDLLELILWKKADKRCKDQKRGIFFHEGCVDRKENISNTANKRCSWQMLQLRCSSWYSIKFYT